jgi:hypothetical protein
MYLNTVFFLEKKSEVRKFFKAIGGGTNYLTLYHEFNT